MNKPTVPVTILVYLFCITSSVLIGWYFLRSPGIPTETYHSTAQDTVKHKPYFSLSTNRTYGTNENARFFISYQGIDSLDFRVYKVKDPASFFKKLANPHGMGVEEERDMVQTYHTSPSVLETTRSFKFGIYSWIRNYFREELKRETRTAILQKVRGKDSTNEESERLPLNIADYARVPLLNSDQVVASWREHLARDVDYYDTHSVPLGKREPGVYLVEAVNGDLRAYTIAVVTDLATIDKVSGDGSMIVYAVDRVSGAPRDNINIEIVNGSKTLATGITDHDGILKTSVNKEKPQAQRKQNEDEQDEEEFNNEDANDEEESGYQIMATGSKEFSISDLNYYAFSGGDDRVTSYLYTDRPVYRPAQKVFFKGILRVLGKNGYESVGGSSVNVTIEDPKEGKILETQLPLSARGTFNGEVEIADGAPLGDYRITATANSGTASSYFEVLEYKKPEYKVTVKTDKPFVPVGESTKFTIDAKYFFGEPVRNAEVNYYIYRSRYYHWWWRGESDADDLGSSDDEDNDNDYYGYGNDIVKDGKGTLAADGTMVVDFEVPQADAEHDWWDYSYRLEAQVTDASRSVITGKASFVGTRGSILADANPARWIYYTGEVAKINVKTSDYEGHPVSTAATLRFTRRWWEKIVTGPQPYDDSWKTHEDVLSSLDVTTDAQGLATCDYTPTNVGDVEIAVIVREKGKEITSHGGYIWVVDRNDKWGDFSYEEQRGIKLIPDKTSYQPGETAHVLAMLPEEDTHLLVTTELMAVQTVRHIDAAARAVMIDVPIDATCSPNVYLNVAFVKDGDMFSTDKMLGVPSRNKMLDLKITPDKQEYKPGETASYTIAAKNSDGSPAVGAEVSVGVVDEAIYSIRPDNAGDIRKAFYGKRYNQVRTIFSTSYHFTGHSGNKPMNIASLRKAYQLADFKNESQYVEPTIRKKFMDTAFWLPDVLTGADGIANVHVTLPDNLTTWRTTARAVTADLRVGSAVEKVIARKHLILRMETPRFLTEGDVATFSAVVHNYLDAEKSTKIELAVTGGNVQDPLSKTVTIGKQGECRVDWRVSASQIGEVRLIAKALTDEESDGVELPVPVIPHGLQKTIGSVTTLADDNAEQTLDLIIPENAHPLAKVMRLEASPSIAGTLFGSLDYLTGYPYGCTEQTMSSFLPNVIVTQTLQAIKMTSIRPTNDLAKKVERGMERLYGYQHDDGGWGWWKTDNTDPFMSAYVVDGLMMALRAGYHPETNRIERGREKIKWMLSVNGSDPKKNIDFETQAYMVYTLIESAEFDTRHDTSYDAGRIANMFDQRGKLQPYGLALLAMTLRQHGDHDRARTVADELESKAHTNELDAHWESTRTPMLDFQEENNLEATALSLKALAMILPKSPLLPKVARWLVANRTNGWYWSCTKNTAFAIYGLTEYLRVSHELSPDYTVDVYLNGEKVLTHHMTSADAKSAKSFTFDRKWSDLANANHLRIVKHGRGTLYFTGTAHYYQTGDRIESQSSSGLELTREYFQLRVAERNGQMSWTAEPLSGDVRSGDIIVSRLHVKGDHGQYMMIEDPIPAGCEQIERLSGLTLDYTAYRWCNWYSNREFRDQKTTFFLNHFYGDETYQYAMRVIEPGEFRISPARAEMMYRPSVQANTSNGFMKIIDKK